MRKISFKIPFSGFYESVHDVVIDEVLTDGFGGGSDELPDGFWDEAQIDWESLRKYYAKAYVEQTLYTLESADSSVKAGPEILASILDNLVIDSPREYNFRTDELWVDLEFHSYEDLPEGFSSWVASIIEFIKENHQDEFMEWRREQLTPRSGWIPMMSEYDYVGGWEMFELTSPAFGHQFSKALDIIMMNVDEDYEYNMMSDLRSTGALMEIENYVDYDSGEINE